MDKKRKSQFSSKESYERSSPPMSKPERSRSPHRSAHKEKSHRSRSPHVSSRTRESHRSGSPHRSSHTSRSHKSRSHHESSFSRHSSAQSERSSKSQLFQEKEDLQGKDAECWMSSPSGKWQVQTKHTGGREEQLPRAKSGSETSCLIADYQSQMQNTRIFPMENQTQQLVVLEPPGWLAFKGLARMRCICGQVNIYGYDITSSNMTYDVYSPASHSFVCIQIIDGYHGNIQDSPALSVLLEDNPSLKQEIHHIRSFHSPVIMLFEKLPKPAMEFIDTLKPFYTLFRSDNKLKGKEDVFEMDDIGIQVYGQNSQVTQLLSTVCYREINHWINGRVSEDSSPVILVCGGKSVGKSTLTRYLVNTILNRVKEVAFLECDVGQAEFTPGSCISVNQITQPLLGPPFSHQDKPLCCCFLGVLSPVHNPEAYMKCVTYVYNNFIENKMRCPLVVNTMGWNKSIGLALLTDILRLVKPDLVIQIESQSNYKNLPDITSEFIAENTGWISECILPKEVKQYTLIKVKSVVDKLEGPIDHYKPVDHRSLSLLGYFDQLLMDKKGGLNAVVPYEVPWKKVAVHVAHASVPASQIMYALNASVVALCRVDENMLINTNIDDYPKFLKDTPVCPCLGFGIVRGIDSAKKVFYLLTPLSAEETSCVNCLLLGALEIPQPLLLNQTSCNIPYVGYSKDVIGAKSVSKRKHTRRRTKPFRGQDDNKL